MDLEENVAELVQQLDVIPAMSGVSQLIGLLDRVRDDRALVLLAVPRTLTAQAVSDGIQTGDRLWRPLAGGTH
jgi:hypothetical protein